MKISPKTLYVVATPIGNLDDISARALEVLQNVDVIAAEDTRHSKRLLAHFGIGTRLISLHAHNEAKRVEAILTYLNEGKSIALITDAGTPLISDPGRFVSHAVREAGYIVSPIPGACALVAALSASGLPADQFVFLGFLPHKTTARKHALQPLLKETRTTAFYEAPHRILDCVKDMVEVLGEYRRIVIARELTKQFETIHEAPLKDMLAWLEADSNQQRGEFVVMVEGVENTANKAISDEALHVLHVLQSELPLKQASKLAAEITGVPKNVLYKHGLDI